MVDRSRGADFQPATARHGSVLIVGAGPTGLVFALWLNRLGVAVRIVDKTAEAGTTSRALAVQARTLEFYRQIGIAEYCVAGGVLLEGANLWVEGTKAARVPLQRSGEGLSPYPFPLVYPQDEHERLLIERLREAGIEVERRTELVRFEQNDQGVHAVLKGPDGIETIFQAAYLAGCDGASSTVREGLGIDFPGGTYEHLFYVADVVAEGPVTDGELHVDLDDADFLAVFPLKGAGPVRLVGMVRARGDREGDAASFEDVRGRAIEQMRVGIRQVNWFSTYRVHHRVAPRFRDRRIFLLGDAAHIHSPVGGQGMNTGIGDAVNLAWKIAAVLRGEASVDLLDSYEPERIAFARRLVATTDRLFTVVTKRGPIAAWVRTRLFPFVAGRLFRFAWMRRLFFQTVSQIGIHYRHSSLSEGAAGPIRGGDRLPWVEIEGGGDNYAPLESVAWQVHVYGKPRAGLAEVCTEMRVPLHAFAWQAAMGKTGIRQGALYLIRPDGYVGLADPDADPERLRGYFRARALR